MTSKKPKVIKASREEIIKTLWYRGELSWMLRPEQREIYRIIREATGLKFTLYISRRYGKSFICRLVAWEDCLRHKNWQVGFVAPTHKQLARIFGPIDKIIWETAPDDLRPKYLRDAGAWEMPSTGTVMYESGTDDQRYNDLVGMNLHKGFYDEPGNMTDLDKIVYDIIQPMTMTNLKSRGNECAQMFLGTPPRTPAHPYYFIKEECKAEGNYVKKTVHDNSSLTEEVIELYKKESGGEESTTWQREYLCEDVTDTSRAIIPEFNSKAEEELVQERQRPTHFELYGAMDPGFKDFTGYVLGYYDFLNAVWYIEGDLLLEGAPTPTIAKEIRSLENKLFPDTNTTIRFSDTASQVICDMARLHDLYFAPTRKDNLEAQINFVRQAVQSRRLFIHPRCKNLILHLKTGIWNEQKTKFERTKNQGHFDLIAALIYWMRNVDTHTNPYPGPFTGIDKANNFVPETSDDKESVYKELFNAY
jgi:hypothetical protein